MIHKEVESVLKSIQDLEPSWRYTLTDEQDKAHSFGRVKEGKDVKLWSISRPMGEFLKFLVMATGSKNILELGCSAGFSTIWLALGARNNGGHVYTTELLPEKIKLARNHFTHAKLNTEVTLIERDILQVISQWDKGPLDFVFMDADKQEYKKYYELLLPLLKPRGIIVADNAGTHAHLMTDFLERVSSDPRVLAQRIEYEYGLMLICKL